MLATFSFLRELMNQPLRVLFLGGALTLFLLLLDGSLWRFWSLSLGQQQMSHRLAELEEQSRQLEFKIHQAGTLTYIERQATDQFDYVREGDLIFIFSE